MIRITISGKMGFETVKFNQNGRLVVQASGETETGHWYNRKRPRLVMDSGLRVRIA